MPAALAVVFRERLSLAFLDAPVPEQLSIGGVRYVDVGFGDFVSFYDWLRSDEGRVVGVRLDLFEKTAVLLRSVTQLRYVVEGHGLEVYFSSARAFDPEQSADQAFGDNRVLHGADGSYALTLGLRDLGPPELEDVRRADAEWLAALAE